MDCVDRHPHQPHVVALGRGNGSLCFMDLRQHKHVLQMVQAHSSHGKGGRGEGRREIDVLLCCSWCRLALPPKGRRNFFSDQRAGRGSERLPSHVRGGMREEGKGCVIKLL